MKVEADDGTKGLLRLTMACNERCTFCNVPVEDYRPQVHTPDEVVQQQLQAFLQTGLQTLTLSGGEPTLQRERLLHWIRQARQHIPFVELQTNAILIDAAYARALAEAGLTSAFVSLLSHRPDLHDALTLVPGSHARCVEGIRALAAQGIRVTLNPVFTRSTQSTVAAYVAWVEAHLPVTSLSMSFAQPHGRARDLVDLPDYDVIGPQIREALAQTRLRLLNPYCGLPLCIGWDGATERCVEAVEAERGGWSDRPGLENTGDKHQQGPCRRCALRTRCGGAWHAYWTARDGRGIEPPIQALSPFEGPSPAGSALRWLHTDRLDGWPDATDVALDWTPSDRTTLGWLRRIAARNRSLPDAQRCHLWIRPPSTAPAKHGPLLALLARLEPHALVTADPLLAARARRHHPDWLVIEADSP